MRVKIAKYEAGSPWWPVPSQVFSPLPISRLCPASRAFLHGETDGQGWTKFGEKARQALLVSVSVFYLDLFLILFVKLTKT